MQTLRAFEAPVAFTGGPNEGADYLAGGQRTTPSFETHNHDNSLPEQTVSRFDLWRRRIVNNAVARVAFVALSAGNVLTACADGGENSAAISTTIEQPAPATEKNRHCYSDFAELSAAEQQECRELIADMGVNDIAQLSPLDHARWAGYYRFEKLGEPRPAHIEIRAVIDSKKQSIIHSTASRLLMGHQDNIFKMAWLLQNNPAMCTDSRTLQATLGSPDIQSESYKMAQQVAASFPAGSEQLNTYVVALQTKSPLYNQIDLKNPGVSSKGDTFELSFQADTKANKPQHFTFSMFPYLDVIPQGTLFKEMPTPDDPTDPQNVWAPLKEKLIVSPPKITG